MTDPRAAKRAAIRRATLHLVLGVAVLHAIFIAVYYAAHIQIAPPKTRLYFTGAWTFSTALVVAVLLKRVRALRFSR